MFVGVGWVYIGRVSKINGDETLQVLSIFD